MTPRLRSLVTLMGLGYCLVQPVQANQIRDLSNQARELASNGYPTSAIQVYNKAVILDAAQPMSRRDVSLYFNLALLFIDQSQIDPAIAALQQAIVINPNHLKSHFNLGLLYADTGKRDLAQKELGTALALASGNANLAQYILETIEERKLMDSNPSVVAPGSPATPASNSNTAPPVPPAP